MAEENTPARFAFEFGAVVTVNHNDEGVRLRLEIGDELRAEMKEEARAVTAEFLGDLIEKLEAHFRITLERHESVEEDYAAEQVVTLSNTPHPALPYKGISTYGAYGEKTPKGLRNAIEGLFEELGGSTQKYNMLGFLSLSSKIRTRDPNALRMDIDADGGYRGRVPPKGSGGGRSK